MSSKKNFLLKHLISLSTFAVFFSIGWLYASEETATERTMKKLLDFKDKGFTNVRGERRGFLENKGLLKQRIKLFSKQSYLAIVSGDEDIKGIKMVIKDKKGKLMKECSVSGSTAHLEFIPKKKDKYSFFIEVPDKGGYYHFSLATK
jgi:hypothetical protein